MLRKIGFLASGSVALGLMGAPVMAQGVNVQPSGLHRAEGVVAIGLTVPFGGGQRSDPPRVELRMSRDLMQADGSRLSDRRGEAIGTRIGIALDRDGEHRLWLNGRLVAQDDQRQGVSTLGWVAIGVGVAVVGGGLLLFDALDDASE
jgi:hypothetical protein